MFEERRQTFVLATAMFLWLGPGEIPLGKGLTLAT